MNGVRLVNALRASATWRVPHWGDLSSIGVFGLSCLAVLAVNGLVVIALGCSLWSILHGRIEALPL